MRKIYTINTIKLYLLLFLIIFTPQHAYTQIIENKNGCATKLLEKATERKSFVAIELIQCMSILESENHLLTNKLQEIINYTNDATSKMRNNTKEIELFIDRLTYNLESNNDKTKSMKNTINKLQEQIENMESIILPASKKIDDAYNRESIRGIFSMKDNGCLSGNIYQDNKCQCDARYTQREIKINDPSPNIRIYYCTRDGGR